MIGLNLRHNIVADYWKSKDPRLQIILEWMEGMEEWRLDDDKDFSTALMELQPKLESASREGMVDNSGRLLEVMAYMSASRAMRLMEWMDKNYNKGLSVEFVGKAQGQSETPSNQLMLDRLRALQSLALLGKVFVQARVLMITKLLAEQNDRF